MDIYIKRGDIISAPGWAEYIQIDFLEELGEYIRIVGSTVNTRKYVDKLIRKEELHTLKVSKLITDFKADPKQVFLGLETKRYKFISLYDPLLAINTSKVDPLPHQIEAVYGFVLKLPRIRFLIADDPGAGKTIMAGLIIKELKFRHMINKVLIVVPGHLKDQWRRELKERFEENFIIVDRGVLDSFYGENIWQRENQIITSMDFAKRDEVLPGIAATHFDLIIVDEAHKMSAYKYAEKVKRNERYKLGEVLSRIGEHLLFLTATPHKGDPENFRLFLDLLEPGFFGTSEMLSESISKKENPLFIRRVKEDLKNFEGEPLFLPRHVRTITYRISVDSPNEMKLYNELSRYVNTLYNQALSKGRRNIAFALVILQRRFASSIFALMRSLERRKKRLSDMLEGAIARRRETDIPSNLEEYEDKSEEERWQEEEVWETLSVAENREELKREIEELENLSRKAQEIISKEEEIKLRELKRTLKELNQKFPGEKVIIFTESKDTMEYLEKKIQAWGYAVNTIHGGMKLEERIKAENVFKNETQILVATEAAGEGINLQFCHLMINYDIPWNPNRLEQRMGRIHRYGQTKESFIYNLVSGDTREGRVLERLFEKIEEIRSALGSDKVFDVLSEVLYGRNLSQLLLEAAANARSIDEILAEIDIEVDDKYISRVKECLGESLATRFIDYTRIKEMAERAKEYRLIPEYTEAFFKKAFTLSGGKISERKDGFISIDGISYEIKKISMEENFKKRYGTILKRYPKVTFDKEIAFRNPEVEFLSFGHPLFESVLEWVERNFSAHLRQGATFYDPAGQKNGFILFYEGEIRDGKGTVAGKRLFAFYIDNKTKTVTPLNPSIIWDLVEGKATAEEIDIEPMKKMILSEVIRVLEKYRDELLKERERQANIKEKYGANSLEQLILKLDSDLIDLYERKDRGENVDIAIYNKQQRKRNYEESLKKLKENIKYEKTLNISKPEFLGVIRVVPLEKADPAMVTDLEVEKKGMEIAMEYERQNGRIPEDVSSENLGFDIRSRDSQGNYRYIEVKARAGLGDVALTKNEWFKAQRFKNDYYLYVVFNAASTPDLKIIQNPVENLNALEKVETVRYLISSNDILQKGKTEL